VSKIIMLELTLVLSIIFGEHTQALAASQQQRHAPVVQQHTKVRCLAGITNAESARRAEIAQYIKANYTMVGRK